MFSRAAVNFLSETLKVSAWFFLIINPFLSLNSQDSYHITNYRKSEYKAGNQNWDMALDDEGNLFVANSKGLIKMSGSSIAHYELPGKNIIRSVAAINGRVYTGSFREFGYWEPDDAGAMKYVSLVSLLTGDSIQNDEFWKIKVNKGKIYFQSFGKLLCYDENEVISIALPGSILFLLQAGGRLFTQEIGGGLYEILGQTVKYVSGSDIFSDTEVKALLHISENEFLVGTSSKGLFFYNGENFSPWQSEVTSQLMEFKINNGVKLGNKFVFGTIMRGIFVLNPDGKLTCHLHTGTGLQNNTVLALCTDAENNLWAGLDKGFDYIAFNTPMNTYTESEESFGTVYTACLYSDILYVGTNQGIYYFIQDQPGNFSKKNFLRGSQGQVWFIDNIDGNLYCGLNDGTYLIDDFVLHRVSNISGGYNLKKVTTPVGEMMIQSTYHELAVYRKVNDIWEMSHTMNGFGAPARFLEIDHTGNIWLGHTIAGIFIVQPNEAFDNIVKVSQPNARNYFDDNLNHVHKVDNRIIVPTGRTLLQWDAVAGKLVEYESLTTQLQGFEAAGAIVPAGANKYWFIKRNELGLFEVRFDNARLLYRVIPEMYNLELVEDYENIVVLNDSLHLICLENGFSVLDLHSLNRLAVNNNPPTITAVELWRIPDKTIRFVPGKEIRKQFSNAYNNLRFTYSAEGPVGKKKYFQYMLHGFDLNWSNWSSSTRTEYNRLPPGTYTFMLRSLSNQGIITEITQVSVKIRQPWYLTYYAYGLYLFVILILIWLARLNYLRRTWKNKELLMRKEQEEILKDKEQAESEVIRLSNEKLQTEIMLKNTQLANNTMLLIQKNELLSKIQDELEKQKEELGTRIPRKYFSRVNRLIENSFKSDQDWQVFEKLFDQAHENFFQRLKASYPELTSSDLRLCAYLRLNLSSKEIAPLLNISVRGVEERRYRLRKRLQLSSDQNLTEFILSF